MNLKDTLGRKLFEKKLIRSNFFDDIYIKDESLKKKILEWMFYLKKYQNISINKFSYLFSKLDDIKFPLQIHDNSGNLWVEDNSGKKFSFSYSPPESYNMTNFSIRIRTNYFETEFLYHLTSQGEIVPYKKLILQLNKDTNNVVSFRYYEKYQLTTAIFEANNLNLTITYPSSDCIDDSLSTYLFACSSEFNHIDDIFLMLNYFMDLLKKSYFKIHAYTNNGKEFTSLLCVSNGIVTNVYRQHAPLVSESV